MTATENGDRDADGVGTPRRPLGQPGPQAHPAPRGEAPGCGPYPGPRPGGWAPPFPPQPFPPPAPLHAARPTRGLPTLSRNARIAAASAGLGLIMAMVAVIVFAGARSGGDSAGVARPGVDPTASAAPQLADPVESVRSADLPGMLLTAQEAATLAGHPGSGEEAYSSGIFSAPFVTEMLAGSQCRPLGYVGEQATYQGSGFTAMRATGMRAKLKTPLQQDWVLNQSVVAYPSSQIAQDVVVATTGKWRSCEGASWGKREGDRDIFWTAGLVQTGADDLVTTLVSQENGDGWACWRGMTAVSRVVAEFAACGVNPPVALPVAVAAAMAKKISAV